MGSESKSFLTYIPDDIVDGIKLYQESHSKKKYIWTNGDLEKFENTTIHPEYYRYDGKKPVGAPTEPFLVLGKYENIFMLQCTKCKEHYLMKGCPGCGSDRMTIKGRTTSRSPGFSRGFFCSDCTGYFDFWPCPRCGTENSMQPSLFYLKKKGWF